MTKFVYNNSLIKEKHTLSSTKTIKTTALVRDKLMETTLCVC